MCTRHPTTRTASSTVPRTADHSRSPTGSTHRWPTSGCSTPTASPRTPPRRWSDVPRGRCPRGRGEPALPRPAVRRVAHAGAVLLFVGFLVVVLGPRPRRGTRWFWFWLVGGTALGGPADLRRRRAAPAEVRGGGHRPPTGGRRPLERAGRVSPWGSCCRWPSAGCSSPSAVCHRSGSSAADRSAAPRISGMPPPPPRIVPGTPRGGTPLNSPRAGIQQGQVGSSRYAGCPRTRTPPSRRGRSARCGSRLPGIRRLVGRRLATGAAGPTAAAPAAAAALGDRLGLVPCRSQTWRMALSVTSTGWAPRRRTSGRARRSAPR